jgi:hypothetical protein
MFKCSRHPTNGSSRPIQARLLFGCFGVSALVGRPRHTIDCKDYDAMIRYHAFLQDTFVKAMAARQFVVERRSLEVAVKRGLLLDNLAKDIKFKIRIDDSSLHTALTKSEAWRSWRFHPSIQVLS